MNMCEDQKMTWLVNVRDQRMGKVLRANVANVISSVHITDVVRRPPELFKFQ
jgi:hypothetical protein